ncbi:Exopolyphosphatase [Carbonactinospora thermoautotrophica]|uniref:Exopolyphosphatase n=1 Tax=Carbonactinospora thermoautotrophica TaxID=1469144 RepID=A0A132MMA1_9ACTN|nr:Ppx/GppA phosphatase family protein [Carbonactinospora thermoautotrophica]KWW98923.1 Exopolyphosphatase [Carbonactinospora thermoautotrophica]
MRLGVLDVGSNTVHLLVVDAHHGARPQPAYSYKTELRLAELLDDHGRLGEKSMRRLEQAVAEAMRVAEDKGVEELLAFATSAIREAVNGEEVIERVRRDTGVELAVLPGGDEARLTFLAVRRWFGWSSGRLLVLDIGGGSLEMACGIDEEPDVAISLPLGAGRLTRSWFTADPPPQREIRALRKYVRTEIAKSVGELTRFGPPNHAVATSKTFKQLARICGAAPSSEGPYVRRVLSHEKLLEWLPKLAAMTSAERAELPGVSPGRAPQLLAGAVVADAAMDLLEVRELEICPWALREGIILRRLDWMDGRNLRKIGEYHRNVDRRAV